MAVMSCITLPPFAKAAAGIATSATAAMAAAEAPGAAAMLAGHGISDITDKKVAPKVRPENAMACPTSAADFSVCPAVSAAVSAAATDVVVATCAAAAVFSAN